jgi:hypothetical protein
MGAEAKEWSTNLCEFSRNTAHRSVHRAVSRPLAPMAQPGHSKVKPSLIRFFQFWVRNPQWCTDHDFRTSFSTLPLVFCCGSLAKRLENPSKKARWTYFGNMSVGRAGQRLSVDLSRWRGDRAVEGARLEIVCAVNPVPRVRIPPSPPTGH